MTLFRYLYLKLFLVVSLGFSSIVWSSDRSPDKTEDATDLPQEITIGFLPGANPPTLKNQSVELAKKLQVELNVPINVFVSKNYQGLIEAMKNKKVDFAFFSALTYVYAEKEASAKVLLKKVWSEPFYYSVLVSKPGSKVKKLDQIKGMRIVFVDDHSTSGYLYPQVMFKKKGWTDKDFKSVQFSGNHSKSIEYLEDDKADVAAVFSDDPDGKKGAWNKFAKKGNKNFQIIWVSEPIPNDPFTVRQDFYDKYPKFTHSLMFALIDVFQKNKSLKLFSEILGNEDLMPATSRQYDPVREMVKSLGPILK